MKIHIKLVGFVSAALVVPFLLGVFYVRHFGWRYYRRQQGIIHIMIAEELAGTLQDGILQKYEQVLNWAAIGGLPELAAGLPASKSDIADILREESLWSATPSAGSVEQTILLSPISAAIRAFQQLSPEFAEILMTDRHGRLIGASNPTTDYWQADEAWWNAAAALPDGKGTIRGLVYDESAGVIAIDMAVPVYSTENPSYFLGVLKVSLDATRFLKRAAPKPWSQAIGRDLVYPDGRMFACINPGENPEFSKLSEGVLQHLIEESEHWGTVEIVPGTLSLAAVAPIQITESPDGKSGGKLYAVVSRDLDDAMMPVRKILSQLTLWGSVVTLLIALIGYLLATYWFARPIRKLRNASDSFVHYIQMSEQGRFEESWESRQNVRKQMSELEAIRGHDELQGLARDFIRMGDRMLSFLRQIEERLPNKRQE